MFSTLVVRGLGGLLLLAAGLKMYGLAVEPIGRAGFFSEPWVQTAVIEWEIILGLWLIWGEERALAWLAVTATFLAFAAVSFWQGWIGQGSCGCFGAIQVNSWLAFTIDAAILMMLALIRRQALAHLSASGFSMAIRPIVVGACGVLLILGLLTAIGTLTFGTPAAALAYLRGERLSVDPRLVDVGEGHIGEYKEVVVHLRNWTDKPIRVVGGTSDCSCVVTRDLPLTVPASETRSLTVTIGIKGKIGQFTRHAQLFTDDQSFGRFSFRLTGRCIEPLPAANMEVE